MKIVCSICFTLRKKIVPFIFRPLSIVNCLLLRSVPFPMAVVLYCCIDFGLLPTNICTLVEFSVSINTCGRAVNNEHCTETVIMLLLRTIKLSSLSRNNRIYWFVTFVLFLTLILFIVVSFTTILSELLCFCLLQIDLSLFLWINQISNVPIVYLLFL